MLSVLCMCVCVVACFECVCVCAFVHNIYLIVIRVHEIYCRMHPNYCQITILLVVDPFSSSAYPMMTHPHPIASHLPIKTLVARQLPTNI